MPKLAIIHHPVFSSTTAKSLLAKLICTTVGVYMLAMPALAQTLPLPPRAPSPSKRSITATAALLVRSAEGLRQHRTVSARMRQQIRMFGQNLAGSGVYQQANVKQDYLFRLQVQIAVADQPATLLQVCDGRFLWTSRSYPDDQPTTSRVDLNLIRRRLDFENTTRQGRAGDDATVARTASPTLLMGMGGLPRLLEMLAHHYEFLEPRSAELHHVPVWTLTGRLSESSQRLFLADDGELPAHVPQSVTVALGKDDLFPFRIECRQAAEDQPGGQAADANQRPMLITEWFEVAYDGHIDPQQFVFRPLDSEVQDATDAYLAGLLPELEQTTNMSAR